VPAVVYGHGMKPVLVSVSELAFTKAYRAGGENTMISLSVGGKKSMNVIIKDMQLHPLTGRYVHADFLQVRTDEKITANIPIEFIGESPAVRSAGGTLVKALSEIEVSSFPQDLPHAITVDISVLATLEDIIKVKDLVVSEKVSIHAEPETVIALVEAPRSEEELAKLDEKVEADVTKVATVEKKEPAAEVDKKA